jgi:polysaccharide pyruvyl transferase WcaK-like protein
MYKKKIAHFGTFDVDNYGDLLFPHIAEYRLPNLNWQHISPTSNKTGFEDAKNIISFREAANIKFDAMVTGGGNILHLLQNSNTVYNKMPGFEYANLWVGASKLAAKQEVPHIFNSPGVSRIFNQKIEVAIAAKTFKKSSYVSVRESYSKNLIRNIWKEENSVKIVPDTAFDIAKMWPVEQKSNGKYIVVNLNPRYHNPIQETVLYLERISNKLNMPIKFVIIGACHGDKDFTVEVANKLKVPYELNEVQSLKEIAHLIANAELFFGSSMHGLITALSYETPAFLVLNNNPMHKFIGLFEMIEHKRAFIYSSFQIVYQNLNYPIILKSEVKQKIEEDLNFHWGIVNRIINTGRKVSNNFFINNYEIFLRLNSKKNDWKGKIAK